MKVGVPSEKIFLVPLAIMTSSSAADGGIQGKILGRPVVRAGKGITSVISNEDMDDIL